jgi:prephenate dehydratase
VATESPRAGYLGPPGTFSEQALLISLREGAAVPVAMDTIHDAVMAVQEQRVTWAVVPLENSIEGAVTVTLDTLTGSALDVSIVGEVVVPVRHALIAPRQMGLQEIETVVSHPHVPGQCTRFLRGELAHAQVVAASSTAEAVRMLAEEELVGWAAIGTSLAAEIYGCCVLRDQVQDRDDNETRFVWLAHRDGGRDGVLPGRLSAVTAEHMSVFRLREPIAWKTSLVFWGAGADRSGWLVRCLDEFAGRQINLTRIESRPRRERLGAYMFFVDLGGAIEDEQVAEAVGGLAGRCEVVRVFGSYPAA